MLGKNIQSSVVYGDFGQVNSFINTIGDRVDTINYTYDDFYRRTSRKLEAIDKTSTYTYLKGNDGQDTVLVDTFDNDKDVYKYTYDIYGNITSVAKNGVVIESYIYDSLNQLTQVTKGTDVYTYTYDDRGNVLSVKKNGTEQKDYTYSDSNWKDLLTEYNDTEITYDEIGNPLNWRNDMSFTWEYGRRLKGVTNDDNNISYTYDADGLRTSKTVNNVTTEYYWLDGVLQGQKTGNEHIIFLYDENGTAYGMLINNNGTESYYYYLFNLQGDIVGIMDSTGNTVVEYSYDAWGSLLSVTGDTALGNKNPLRYRGYYYDNETGFYYLQSRYYDPEVQRFINVDAFVSTGTGLTGFNMFAYCGNNPVNSIDINGEYGVALFIAAVVMIGCTIGLSGSSEQTVPTAYLTVDDAAEAFATDTYALSDYTMLEYGAQIYSMSKNGETLYYLSETVVGDPHSVPTYQAYVPEGGISVARVHTHLYSDNFSPADIKNASEQKVNSYVIGPSLNLRKFNYSDYSRENIATIAPVPLTEAQKRSAKGMQIVWDSHFIDGACPKGFPCTDRTWPNG